MDTQVSKRRLLMLLKLLRQQTDEEHPLSTAEIIEYFGKQGIVIERRTVVTDIDLLCEAGYDLVTIKGSQNRYFFGTRELELPEVKLLIDAVYASKFITPAKSETLIKKLSAFVSQHQADKLQHRLYVSERIKPVNETVYYSADVIRAAIEQKLQITFQYYEYTPTKHKILKHKGKVYRFSPYDLIWNEDRYYVLGFSNSHNKVISFRVDRMCNVNLNDAPADSPPSDYSIAAYGSKVFDMFDGHNATVTLRCKNDLMRVIVDRFGENVQTEVFDKEHFLATVDVSVSPTFFGWVFQFADGVNIVSPPEIAREYGDMLKN